MHPVTGTRVSGSLVDDEGSSTTFMVILRRHQGVAQATSRTSGRSPPCCNTVLATAGAHGSFAWSRVKTNHPRLGAWARWRQPSNKSNGNDKDGVQSSCLAHSGIVFQASAATPKYSRDPERAQMPSLEPSSSTFGQFLGKRSSSVGTRNDLKWQWWNF